MSRPLDNIFFGRKKQRKKDLSKSNFAIKAKKILHIANEVAADIIRLRDKPRVIDYISIGTRLVNKALDQLEGEFYDFFDEWYDLAELPFSDMLLSAIRRHMTKQVGGHDAYAIMITKIDDEEFGWIRIAAAKDQSGETLIGPYIKHERYNEAMAILGRLLWAEVGTHRILLGASERRGGKNNDSRAESIVKLQRDDDLNDEINSSQRAVRIYDRVKLFLQHDEHRSILLLGPPGTGKTTIMKYIARRLNMPTLRINVNDMAQIHPSTIVTAVTLLNPTVLLIDDFDKYNRGTDSTILTQLEQVNRTVKVFMVSVNDIMDIDPAVVRPGRFDEIEEIIKIDHEVVEQLLATIKEDVPDDIKNELIEWPVAYIDEFVRRIKVLGVNEAIKEVTALRKRIESINNRKYRGFNFDIDRSNDGINEEILDAFMSEFDAEELGLDE